MTARKAATRSSNPRHDHGDELKDEVYRQMFRLEANRRGADLDLATALVRGWLESYSEPEATLLLEWLKKISPLCLQMIEEKQHSGNVAQARIN
jgi:hypothetical protein